MNPTLATLVAQYAILNGPVYATWQDTGNPGGLPSFNPSEPPFVFAECGPQAFQSIWTGPGLTRAVFNAALWLQEHGTAPVNGAQPVSAACRAAAMAYAQANPTLVPTGPAVGPAGPAAAPVPIGPPTPMPATGHIMPAPLTTETLSEYFVRAASAAGGNADGQAAFIMGGQAVAIAAELQIDSKVPANWPMIVDCWTNWAAYFPAQAAAGAAFDQKIAQQDAGTGSIDITTLSTQDLTYIEAELGYVGYSQFIPHYTNGSVIQQKNASMLFDQANPTVMAGYTPPAALAGAVASFKSSQEAALLAKQAAKGGVGHNG